jgi:hypothetical protein
MAVKLAGGRMAVEMTAGIADTTRIAVATRQRRANFPTKFVDIACSTPVDFTSRVGWVERRRPVNLSQASILEATITFELLAITHRVSDPTGPFREVSRVQKKRSN